MTQPVVPEHPLLNPDTIWVLTDHMDHEYDTCHGVFSTVENAMAAVEAMRPSEQQWQSRYTTDEGTLFFFRPDFTGAVNTGLYLSPTRLDMYSKEGI